MYPDWAFLHCGCEMDVDPPRFPAPSGKCECGFYCPGCMEVKTDPAVVKRVYISFKDRKEDVGCDTEKIFVCTDCWQAIYRCITYPFSRNKNALVIR